MTKNQLLATLTVLLLVTLELRAAGLLGPRANSKATLCRVSRAITDYERSPRIEEPKFTQVSECGTSCQTNE